MHIYIYTYISVYVIHGHQSFQIFNPCGPAAQVSAMVSLNELKASWTGRTTLQFFSHSTSAPLRVHDVSVRSSEAGNHNVPLCVQIYIYIYICVCVYVCMYVCMYVCICICKCMCICMCTCICICMCVCKCMCMCMCMCICVCILYIYICVCA